MDTGYAVIITRKAYILTIRYNRNNKKLHKHHEQFLNRLFPTYDFHKCPVKFPTVQQQPNSDDCGVFAIALAISLLFNIKPEKVKYEQFNAFTFNKNF